MKKILVIICAASAFLIIGCCEPMTIDEQKFVKNDAEAHFNKMTQLVKSDSIDAFKKLISENATLFVEGSQLAKKDVKDYLAKIFGIIVGPNTKVEVDTFYTTGRNSVYHEYSISYSPMDTTKGFKIPVPPIIINYYLKSATEQMKKKTDKPGYQNYTSLADSSVSRSMSVVGRVPIFGPIKGLVLTSVFERIEGKWYLTHGNLSLREKPSKKYKLKETKIIK